MQRLKFGPEGGLFKKREELVKPIQDKVYTTIERFAKTKVLNTSLTKAAPLECCTPTKKTTKQKT
jgi:outer membrane protein